MRRRIGLCLLLACAPSCQLFLSFGESGTASDGDASATVEESGASNGDGASGDGAADASRDDGGQIGDARPVADGACVLPPGTTGNCPAAGTLQNCVDGGALWNGHCYFTVAPPTVMFSYAAARQACANAGALLASITCDDEWKQAKSVLGNTYYVIGAQGGTTCTWPDDEPWTFAPWASGNPSDAAGFECVKVDTGGWYSFPCGSDNVPRALCERQ